VNLNDTAKHVNTTKLVGKWFEVFGTQLVHKSFENGCTCPTLVLKQQQRPTVHPLRTMLKAAQNKNATVTAEKLEFGVFSSCFNQTASKIITANGTLMQAMKDKFPGAFRIEFFRDEKEELEESKEKNETAITEVGEDGINFLIMHVELEKEAILVAGPRLDGAWILSKRPDLSETDVRQLLDFARLKGISSMVKTNCPRNIRERMDKA